MSTTKILLSGFGGQGILFSGKFLAYNGLVAGKHVSWLPSYGPEMRGGTASCSVIISDDPIGSPIISEPDILIAMNLPSLDKYEDSVVKGGLIVVDSTMVERKVNRTDVEVIYIPATKLAQENNIPTLANMIIAGKVMDALKTSDEEAIRPVLQKIISARHADMFDLNLNALKIGANFKE